MATNADFMEYVREQIGAAGEVAFRKMFGEYAVYLGGKVVALLCDNQFYLKPTAAGRELLGSVTEAPPFPGANLYFRLDAALEDPELMVAALRTTAAALPAPKPKAARRPKAGRKAKSRAGSAPDADVQAKAQGKANGKANSKGKTKAKGKAKAKARANAGARPPSVASSRRRPARTRH